jgi:hypothetical protein
MHKRMAVPVVAVSDSSEEREERLLTCQSRHGLALLLHGQSPRVVILLGR